MDFVYDYDAIIIGAGIGGLFCANLLTNYNEKVLVIEQHSRPGGYCCSFKRKGFVFDAAAHILGSLGGRRNIVGRIVSHWDLGVNFIPISTMAHLKFPEKTFTMDADLSRLIADLKKHYGADAKGLAAFEKEITKIVRHFFRDDPTDPVLLQYRDLVFQDLLDRHIVSREAQAILSGLYAYVGLPPSRCSVFAMCALLTSYLVDGTFYIEGGFQKLADQLALRLTTLGGEIRFRQKVTEVVLDHGAASGVRTHSGEVISSPTVVANGTLEGLLPESMPLTDVYQTIFGEDIHELPSKSGGSYAYYIGAKIDDDTASRLSGVYFNNSDMNAPDNFRFHIAVPSLHDPSLAPPGHHAIIVMLPMEEGSQNGNDRTKRDQLQQWILKEMEGAAPGFGHSVVHVESASPATFERYTLNPGGACYGYEKNSKNIFIDVQTRIPGLYQAGHYAYPSCGIAGASYSALTAAKKIISNKNGGDFKLLLTANDAQNPAPPEPATAPTKDAPAV